MTLLIYQTLGKGLEWHGLSYIPWNGKALQVEPYPPPPYAAIYDLLEIFLHV